MATKLSRISRRRRQPVEDSDEYQDACLGLLFAAKRFDPSLDNQFSTYASRCIFGYIMKGKTERKSAGTRSRKNKATWKLRDVPFSQIAKDHEDWTIESIAVHHDPEPPCVLEEFVEKWLSPLSKRDGAIVYAHLVEKWTLEEIGRKCGVSRERIRQIVERSKRRLQIHLSGKAP